MTRNEELPSYRQLPVRPDAPPGSSWGLWGDDDQLGTLNLLTDERTQRAAALVRRGAVFPLNLPLHEPQPHLAWRTPPTHHILHVGHEARGIQPGGADDPSTGLIDRDDYIDGLWLQAGSQWDSLSHVRHRQHGNYNGIADQEIHGGPGTKLGTDQWARRAIVGRGVLVDVARHLAGIGRDYDPNSAFEVTVDDLEGTLAAQGLEVEDGDILVLHTGWMQRFLDADTDERKRMIAWETIHTPGLEPSERMVEWLWDHHVAAVASDTAGVEALSPDPEFFLHLALLPLPGTPLGEFWVLDALARDCANDGQYACLLVSVPLNLRGGVGSPPQAVAIK
jgi:kynurenine formamidase